MSASETKVVCVGFPAFYEERFLARMREVPGVEPVVLPIDPDTDWLSANPSEAWPEPPPWGTGVADARRAALARAEVLVALHAPEDLMTLAPKLRWIQGIAAGAEQFAHAGVARDLVTITNASGVSAPSMAEWVLGRLLQVWKLFPESDGHQRDRAFVRTFGRTFDGSTIGIVGLGSIGVEVSKRVRAMGCRVLGMRRSAKSGDTSPHADALFGTDALHEMLGQCDAVVIAAPASPETFRLFDEKALAAMRPDAVLVNVARGSLLDEAALVAALGRGHLAAAVLDVFDEEPLPPTHPLWDAPRALLSAHSSVSVDRYMDDVFELFFDNLVRWVEGEPLRNVLDLEALGFAASS